MGFTIKLWLIGIIISLQIFKSNLCANKSRVCVTDPSIEFSIGTTPLSHSPEATLSKTAGIVQYETMLSLILLAASCVNVPSGPKNEIGFIKSPP